VRLNDVARIGWNTPVIARGEATTVTITIGNPIDAPLVNLLGSYAFPDGLEVLSAETTLGTVAITRQAVTAAGEPVASGPLVPRYRVRAQFLPKQLAANASSGQQLVLVGIPRLDPGQSALVTIRVRVRPDAQTYVFAMEACTTVGQGAETVCSTSSLLVADSLPAAGQSPWSIWRLWLLRGMALLVAASVVWRYRRTRRAC
jgi:hypothetical protein